MKFEWNETKSLRNKRKHGIDFETATDLWNDGNRVELHASHPLEDRGIMIGEIGKKLWTAIFTMRGETTRIISVRRARKREGELYGQKGTS
ncbi:MAG: BrnT family toxin [Thermodesulfobacteriota bacterium]|nr:BrnT family toxin [Thermodesulfobacteriota bacterium]